MTPKDILFTSLLMHWKWTIPIIKMLSAASQSVCGSRDRYLRGRTSKQFRAAYLCHIC